MGIEGFKISVPSDNASPPTANFPFVIPSNKKQGELSLRFFFGGGGAWGFCYFGMLEELAKQVQNADPIIQNAKVEFVAGTSAGSQMALFMGRTMNLGYNFAESLQILIETTKPFFDEFATFQGNWRIAQSFNFGRLSGENAGLVIEKNLARLLEKTIDNIPYKTGDTHTCITSSLQRANGEWAAIHNIGDQANILATLDSCRVKNIFEGRVHDDGLIWDGGYTENPTLTTGLASIGMSDDDINASRAFNVVALVEDPASYAHANSKEPKPISVGGREMVSSHRQLQDIENLISAVGADRVAVTSMFNHERKKPWYYSEYSKFIPNWISVQHFRSMGRDMGRESFTAMAKYCASSLARKPALA